MNFFIGELYILLAKLFIIPIFVCKERADRKLIYLHEAILFLYKSMKTVQSSFLITNTS